MKAKRGPLKMTDVARLAGVSTATISRVVNNSPMVDARTAEHVRQILAKVRYVPNNTGAALKSGRSGILGLIVPDLTNPFFCDFVRHFEREVVERDQEMLLASMNHSQEQMQRAVRRMLMRGVEGLIVLDSEIETASYETMLHNRLPLVTLNRLCLEEGVSDVAVETVSGMLAALLHLMKLGHRHIGFLGGKPGQSISRARDASFVEAMKLAKLPPGLIVPAHFEVEGGRDAIRHILSVAPQITAVLCANDLSALGAMAELADMGITPGKDFSVVGLDDIDLCTMIRPALTTLRSPREPLVNTYLDALKALIANPHEVGQQFTVELELVIRQSTGPAPARAATQARRRKAS